MTERLNPRFVSKRSQINSERLSGGGNICLHLPKDGIIFPDNYLKSNYRCERVIPCTFFRHHTGSDSGESQRNTKGHLRLYLKRRGGSRI